MPVLTTIDLTEDDSRDSSQSSSTLSGSSSQEGQNGSAELAAEEPESREAGIALEYQVRGAPCSAASPLPASPSPCAGQWEGSGSLSPLSGWAPLQHRAVCAVHGAATLPTAPEHRVCQAGSRAPRRRAERVSVRRC